MAGGDAAPILFMSRCHVMNARTRTCMRWKHGSTGSGGSLQPPGSRLRARAFGRAQAVLPCIQCTAWIAADMNYPAGLAGTPPAAPSALRPPPLRGPLQPASWHALACAGALAAQQLSCTQRCDTYLGGDQQHRRRSRGSLCMPRTLGSALLRRDPPANTGHGYADSASGQRQR